MQMETTGVIIEQHHIQILNFTDDFNILGDSLEDTERVVRMLEQTAGKIGLKINACKTKIMNFLDKL